MPKDIEDILSGKTPEQTENTAETATEAATEADTSIPRDEKGRFASKATEPTETVVEQQPPPVAVETPPQAPPADPDSDPKNWTYAAYKDEKSKRQAEAKGRQQAEARAQQLETALQEFQKQQTPPPDQFQDPEGYNAYWENRFKTQQEDFEQRFRAHEANVSFRNARTVHGQLFDEAYQALIEEGESGNRAAVQAIIASPDPGEAIVQWHRKEKVAREVGDDLPGYIERVIAERLAAKTETEPKPQVQMPTNLAGQRSVGARTKQEWSGPQPITDIFDRRAKQLGKR